MAKKRRMGCYPQAFKEEAVRLAGLPDRTTKEVAEELGIHPNQLTRWKREFKGKKLSGRKSRKTPEQMQILALEGELARVRDERDILKKTIGYLSPRRKRSTASSSATRPSTR